VDFHAAGIEKEILRMQGAGQAEWNQDPKKAAFSEHAPEDTSRSPKQNENPVDARMLSEGSGMGHFQSPRQALSQAPRVMAQPEQQRFVS
jgi:hypothetical protein